MAKYWSGILNVDKPPGMTSHDVVAIVRRLARQRKVGHAGTLDPLATGVLLVCLGKATRVSEMLMRSPKTYRAEALLGVSTTTDDAEGEILEQHPVSVTRGAVEEALRAFVGRIEQVPPRYSAIKRQGKRLYQLARQGIEVEIPARPVEIHGITLEAWETPRVRFEVRCGPGTYIRALARDLGQALGCGAHLTALQRTSSGQFSVADAVSLAELRASDGKGLSRLLHPTDVAYHHLPALHVDGETARKLAMGQAIPVAAVGSRHAHVPSPTTQPTWDQDRPARDVDTAARAYGPGGQFIALLSRKADPPSWRPQKVFVDPSEILPDAHIDD